MPSTSNTGHYDQSLLSQAAAPTRQQLQEGYQTDLLNNNATKSSSSPSQTHPNANADYESGHAGLAAASSKEHLAGPINGHGAPADRAMLASSQRRTPFWRSRNGIIAIVVGLLVIIAIAVGVGVGVSRNRSNNNNNGGLESSSSSSDAGLEPTPSSEPVTTKPSFTQVPTTFTTTSTELGSDRSPTATITTVVTTTTAVEVTGQTQVTQPVESSPSPIKEPAGPAADAITSLGAAGGTSG